MKGNTDAVAVAFVWNSYSSYAAFDGDGDVVSRELEDLKEGVVGRFGGLVEE